MISGDSREGLEKAAHTPFGEYTFFDPAPLGRPMDERDFVVWIKKQDIFGWCFDCVRGENSLYLKVAGGGCSRPFQWPGIL